MRPISTLLFVTTLFLLTACQSVKPILEEQKTSEKPTYFVYLAGPEVFLPDPIQAGIDKKNKIEQLSLKHNWPFKLVGLYPMDNEIKDFKHDFKTGMAIYTANIDLMQKANFVTANMIRFRGPSMDVGTAFEMGYMLGIDKPVFAYYDSQPFYGTIESPGIYKERVAKHYPLSKTKPGTDINGQSIEDFEMADNLMMIGALKSGSGTIATSFEKAILQIAEHIEKQGM